MYLERVQVPDTLHYQLAGIQHVELFAEQEEEAFNGMLGALHTIGVAINENIEIKPRSVAKWIASRPVHPQKTGQKQKPLIVGLALNFTLENKGDSTKISPVNGSAIALVPFRNIGPQQEDSLLAEGNEIEAMLSMAPNLMVKRHAI